MAPRIPFDAKRQAELSARYSDFIPTGTITDSISRYEAQRIANLTKRIENINTPPDNEKLSAKLGNHINDAKILAKALEEAVASGVKLGVAEAEERQFRIQAFNKLSGLPPEIRLKLFEENISSPNRAGLEKQHSDIRKAVREVLDTQSVKDTLATIVGAEHVEAVTKNILKGVDEQHKQEITQFNSDTEKSRSKLTKSESLPAFVMHLYETIPQAKAVIIALAEQRKEQLKINTPPATSLSSFDYGLQLLQETDLLKHLTSEDVTEIAKQFAPRRLQVDIDPKTKKANCSMTIVPSMLSKTQVQTDIETGVNLIKASGMSGIEIVINDSDPKKVAKLAEQIYAACTKAGYDVDDIVIKAPLKKGDKEVSEARKLSVEEIFNGPVPAHIRDQSAHYKTVFEDYQKAFDGKKRGYSITSKQAQDQFKTSVQKCRDEATNVNAVNNSGPKIS